MEQIIVLRKRLCKYSERTANPRHIYAFQQKPSFLGHGQKVRVFGHFLYHNPLHIDRVLARNIFFSRGLWSIPVQPQTTSNDGGHFKFDSLVRIVATLFYFLFETCDICVILPDDKCGHKINCNQWRTRARHYSILINRISLSWPATWWWNLIWHVRLSNGHKN